MILTRDSESRGHSEQGWLDTRYTFSFGDYYNPKFLNFKHLTVINEELLQPGQGFGPHIHRDLEIITFLISGEIEHNTHDSNKTVIRTGDVQCINSGAGFSHSEYNPTDKPAHRLQVWIVPRKSRLKPSSAIKHFSPNAKHNQFCLIASEDGRDGSLLINQSVDVYSNILDADDNISYPIETDHFIWIQIIRGDIKVNGHLLSQGDGAEVFDEQELLIEGLTQSEFIIFDMQ